ncbi:MAG: Ig-like domain-containing protein [Solobacterium sp.]|nr:Ig-like domain-containing protein [Solobacterium sp.]
MKYRTMILTALCLLLNITCLPVAAQTDAPEDKPDGRFTEPVKGPVVFRQNTDQPGAHYDREIAIRPEVDYYSVDQIRDMLIAREPEIVVEYKESDDYMQVAEDMIFLAMNHTMMPDEGDYLYEQWKTYSYRTYRNTGDGRMMMRLNMTYRTTAAQEAETTEAVRSVLDSLNVYNKNSYQKIKAVYEWIASHVSYVDEGDISHTAYSAIVRRQAVCQGYATLFYRMMLELGENCRYIPGIGNGGNHGWNIVQLGDQFYNIDVTWASTAHNNEKYFLRGSDYFEDHTADAVYQTDAFTSKYPISRYDYSPTETDLNTGDFIQGVQLQERRINLPLDQTVTLHASVLPSYISQDVTFTSMYPEVAEVDAYGNVTPKKEGLTYITVESPRGGRWRRCQIRILPEQRLTGRAFSLYADDGTGYGDLVFFRSYQLYTENQYGTFTDIAGNQHTGQLFITGYESTNFGSTGLPWASVLNKIRKAYVAEENGIRPWSTARWFWESSTLQSFNGAGINTARLENMYAMFVKCTALTSAALKLGNTKKCEDFGFLFADCTKLKEVSISGLTKESMKEEGDKNFFRNCSALQKVTFGSSKYQLVPELPEHWKKDTYTKTWKQLKDEYPDNAKQYAGTWTKTHVHTYGTPTYTWSSDNKTVTAKAVCTANSSHVVTETVKTTYARTKQPTRTATGTGVYTAKFTNSMFKTQTKTITVAKLPSIAMYRLYNPNSWEHFYTGNAKEKDALVKMGWKYEGVGWYAPKTSKTPVYRLYNPNNGGDHHYTMNKKEYDALCNAGWTGEGVRWYSDDAKGVPVYREYNPGAAIRNHNYTANKKEHNALISYGWKDEGIGWYGMK